ncbi:MAG: hypothetical protein NC339_01470 [Muribaculaceae bacterium]|nr:hypothetical protein [Muribaculaceae bacterium]
MPNYLKIIFSLTLVVYLAVSLVASAGADSDVVCTGVNIEVEPTEGANGFVTREEIGTELDSIHRKSVGMQLSAINTQKMRRHLLAMDKLEDASVVKYTDGSIRISVKPIVPVARVFDGDESYYINRQGKRVKAGARFRKNVPLITGHFDEADTAFTPLSLLPLLDFIASDSIWNTYVTMIDVRGPHDIFLIPSIREHVVNLGDMTDIPLKFDRLRQFYAKVLPSQGWEKYDTLSLKWRGQLVATKRHRRAHDFPVRYYDEDESVSVDAMMVSDSIAPGTSVAGEKSTIEPSIPRIKK